MLAACAVGCSSEDEGSCPPPSACDVTAAGCQQLIFQATACERKQEDAVAPVVRVISVSQFVDEMNAAAMAPTEDQVAWETAMQMLALLPAGTSLTTALTEASVDNVAAYYDPETQRVSIIDRNEPGEPLDDLLVLSHEFAHALQDQEVNINAYRDERTTSLDSFVSLTSLIEGEATVLGIAVTGRAQGGAPPQLNWSAGISAMWTGIFESIQASTAPFITAIQSLPYPLGTEYLYPRWLDGGQASTDAVYAEPPLKVLDWEARLTAGSLAQPLDCYPTTAPAGYAALGHDSLGLTGVLGIWMASGQVSQSAWYNSMGWRGDSLVVYRSTTGAEVAVAWRTRWETNDDARQMAMALETSLPATSFRQTIVENTELTLLVATNGALVTDWNAAQQCGTVADLPETPLLDPTTNAALRKLTQFGSGPSAFQ